MNKLYKKHWVLAVAASIILGIGVALFTHSEPTENNRSLVVGVQSGYPPFEFMDSNGNIVGFDIDLAKIIASKLDKELAIKDMDFEGVILSLKQGKIDLIMSGMNITPSRIKEIDMVPYHGEAATHLSLIFWGEIPKNVENLEDMAHLSGASISVESGSIPEAFMSHYPSIQVKSFQSALGSLMDVKYGKSTASLVEPDVADYLKRQHSEIKIIPIPLPPNEQILGCGIGIKKENQELFHQVSMIIQELKESGVLKQLENQWFKEGDHG